MWWRVFWWWVAFMDMGDPEMEGRRPLVAAADDSAEQRRLARQAERIREMERLMRGAAAFSRKQAD